MYPRFGPGQMFILETDASTVCLGAVLSQEQEDGTIHLIVHASREYGISELVETQGLVWDVRYFCWVTHVLSTLIMLPLFRIQPETCMLGIDDKR